MFMYMAAWRARRCQIREISGMLMFRICLYAYVLLCDLSMLSVKPHCLLITSMLVSLFATNKIKGVAPFMHLSYRQRCVGESIQ